MSVSDELMWRYYSLVLCVQETEIQTLKAKHPRQAKDELARRIVARFHGPEQAEAASAEFARVFAKSELPADIPEISIQDPTMNLPALLVRCKLAASNGEARRLVEQGAVRIDDEKITDLKNPVVIRRGMVIRSGKRGFARVIG